MEASRSASSPLSNEWCAEHFDYRAHEVSDNLTETLRHMRSSCPVTHSDQQGGYWIATRYEDILRIAQDWETFSSALGVAIPSSKMVLPAIPEHLDPPLHRIYKRLINPHFTPAVVADFEEPTLGIVTRLIDEFIESGSCDFMEDFARPFPGLAFFELALHAPPDEAAEVNRLATSAQRPDNPKAKECWEGLISWIGGFVEARRRQPPRGDVVDAVIGADIDGRPITDEEIMGVIQLLILGGLDTSSGALGQFMIRFARQPEIPALLREQPELVPDAVEELLRLDSPFIGIGRTVSRDTELGGQQIKAGEKVMIYWASANRDEDEFEAPDVFDLARGRNRHLTFGAGPHRCAGSNLARLNLRLAVRELTARLDDVQIPRSAEPIAFHSAFSRSPITLPITFAPGPTIG
jgi:cytochrome P450